MTESKMKSRMLRASRQDRILNFLLDNFMISGLLKILDAVLGVNGKEFTLIGRIEIYFIVVFLYFFISEAMFSKTIGKAVTKSIVVSLDGTRASFKQIALRSLVRMIPFESVTFLLFPIGWHDSLSETTVITKRI